jgi:ATP-dependent helicase HrpB
MGSSSYIELPIDRHIDEILQAFVKKPNVILTAPPGSGKTLRVPISLMKKTKKKIIVLVPKRIAAISAANRVAEENQLSLGFEVGYQVRFDNRTQANTRLIFMTEGVFIKKITDAAFLNSIDTIVFDEFHERSSANDIAFGYCFERQLLQEADERLKILVMSATLETKTLENFLQDVVTVNISSPPYPLQIVKSKKAQRLQFDPTAIEYIVGAAQEAWRTQKKDILIFLPGLHEIRLVQNKLNQILVQAPIDILHGSIRLDEQKRILSPNSQRRIILATNIAESSLTLPSVDAVIDSGLEKKAIFENKIGFQKLELKRISLFSAAQRAGRAARVGPGVCYQMWHESDERSMSQQIEPEIYKSSLLEEALILLSLDVQNPQQFSWLTKPAKSFDSIFKKFKTWNLVDGKNQITHLGQLVQRCPLDIERSLLFIELCQRDFKTEASAFLAFLESTDFTKFGSAGNEFNLDHIGLNDRGRQIQNQLSQLNLQISKVSNQEDFKTTLIRLVLKLFPEKMAQKKEQLIGLSALGRGVQFASYLVTPESDYFLLLSGRDISDSTTLIDFAISFSEKDFARLSQIEQRLEIDYPVDFEKRMIYKQERKMSGFFVLNTTSKMPLDSVKDKAAFERILLEKIDDFIKYHPQSPIYFKKINFLKKKAALLRYEENTFDFLKELNSQIYESLAGTISNIDEFMNFNLYPLLLYLTPEPIKKDLEKLHSMFELPSGKQIPIDYEAELAPLVSVRIQEALGIFKTPFLLDQRLPITFELLAPNYRPAQITSQLENFWRSSYLDVRKDLRARYPKHDWPDNPLDWKPEMSKRIKKQS